MAKRSSSMDQFLVRSDSSTATSDQGYSSAASSSAGGRKPAAAAADKKQRFEPSMALAAAASSGALPPPFPIFTQQSPAQQQEIVCRVGDHNNGGQGTPLPLSHCKTKLSKASGLAIEDPVEQHVQRLKQLTRPVPAKGTCDRHLRNQAGPRAKNNAKTSAKLVVIKHAAAEAVPLTGGLDRVLLQPEIIAKRNGLSAPGTLLHALINGLALPGTDTAPAKPLPFNIDLGLARRYGGKGPDGELLPGLDPKDCKEVEAFAFTTTRANYRGRVTDPGRNSVLNATMYFKTKVIYVSRRRFNAGELERALLKMCIDDLRLRHLINQNRGGDKMGEDAEWQAVSITYLDLTVPGAEELVIHMGSKRIGA
ncbi:hypothetical protein JKP88DRAFT_280567 [Tribonema minus]|uniref:Uncharacterized protein n=1 Tax=Tribonema minus TaxID=303371 RepID=A0A835YQI0_9STRA|nr:hypothetical protein JKP88DRAFT_280567 [Tribonema minus]